jgi:hypothetical protein
MSWATAKHSADDPIKPGIHAHFTDALKSANAIRSHHLKMPALAESDFDDFTIYRARLPFSPTISSIGKSGYPDPTVLIPPPNRRQILHPHLPKASSPPPSNPMKKSTPTKRLLSALIIDHSRYTRLTSSGRCLESASGRDNRLFALTIRDA